MLGRFFFPMLINLYQYLCLHNRLMQTSISLGSNNDKHQQQTSISSLLTAQSGEQSLADAPSSLPLQRGQECSLIPQHGESRNPDLEKCCGKSEGTMPLCLRTNSLFSLSSESKIPQVQCTFLLTQEAFA